MYTSESYYIWVWLAGAYPIGKSKVTSKDHIHFHEVCFAPIKHDFVVHIKDNRWAGALDRPDCLSLYGDETTTVVKLSGALTMNLTLSGYT